MLHLLHVSIQQMLAHAGIGHAFEGELTIIIAHGGGCTIFDERIGDSGAKGLVHRRSSVVCNSVHLRPVLHKHIHSPCASGEVQRSHTKLVAGIGVSTGLQ